MPYTPLHLPINLLRRLACRPRRSQVTTREPAMPGDRCSVASSVVIAVRSCRGPRATPPGGPVGLLGVADVAAQKRKGKTMPGTRLTMHSDLPTFVSDWSRKRPDDGNARD